MTKIVVNRCYGGFGLSYEAMKRLAELKGYDFYAYGRKARLGNDEYIRVQNQEKASEFFSMFYLKVPYSEYQEMSVPESKKVRIDVYKLDRDDEDLVQVVEELESERASSELANLVVREIPDDVEWEIDNYDGMESIEEKHRSW